jgi:hypothetical protein
MKPCWMRTLQTVAVAGGAGLVAMWSSAAMAQVSAPGPMTPTGGLPTLPGAGARLFELDVNGRVEYDSNVARGQTVVANAKSLHKDDVLYQPSATVNLNLPVGRQALFLTGNVGYDFHQYNSDLNSERINLTGGGSGRLGPCTGAVTLGFARNQSDQVNLPIQVSKNIQTVDSAGLQLRCGERALSEFVSVSGLRAENSANVGLVSSTTVSTSAGVSYQNHAVGQISIFGSYSTSDYGSNNDPTLPPLDGFRSYSAGVSIARPIGHRLNGSAELSYQTAKGGGANTTEFTGFGGQGSLEYRVNSRISAELLFSRNVEPALQQSSSFTIVDLVQFDVRYKMTSRLSTGIGTIWHKVDYRGSQLVPNLFVTNDRSEAVYANASLNVGRHGALAVDVRRETRNTNLTIFNYTDYRVGVTATQSF